MRVWNRSRELAVELEEATGSLVLENDGIFVADITGTLTPPVEFGLHNLFPNPFNTRVSIRYGLPEAGRTSLKVYDVSGRAVATIVDEIGSGGYHIVTWNGEPCASGLYFIRLNQAGAVQTRKVMLIR